MQTDALPYKKMSLPETEVYHFFSRKYGIELLVDIGRIESLPNFVRDETPHQLSFYEIVFIKSGAGIFMLEEHEITIEPGTIIFTSPGQIRRWYTTKPVTGYVLFFEKDFLNLFFTDDIFLYRLQYFHQYSQPTSIRLLPQAFTQILQLLENVEDEFMHLQNDSGHFVRAILYQLLVTLNRHYADQFHIQRDTTIHPDFYRFRSLLEKDFLNNQRVIAYAQKLKISPTHLNKLCRQYSGLSAQQMIHYKLISEIKKQLYSSLSVKEIAYKFNFSDPSNFNRFFKKLTGITPQQYRDGL